MKNHLNCIKKMFWFAKISCLMLIFSFQFCTSTKWIKPGFKDDVKPKEEKEEQIIIKKKPHVPVKEIEEKELKTKEGFGVGSVVNTAPKKVEKKESVLFDNDKKAAKEYEKKPKHPVHYSGSQFIREVKVHPYVKRKELVLSIAGNAKIKYGTTNLNAPLIEVIGDKQELSLTSKGLEVDDKKEKFFLKAGLGEFRKFEDRLLVQDKPLVIFKGASNGKDVTLTAKEIERLFGPKIIRGWGNVSIKDEEFLLFSQKAVMYEDEKKVIAEEDPKIYQKENVFAADIIRYFINDKKAFLENNVEILYVSSENHDADKKNNSKDKKEGEGKITTIIKSNKAEYEFSDDKPENKKIIMTGDLNNLITIENEDFYTECLKITALGEGPDEVIAEKNVQSKIKQNNTFIYSQIAYFYKEQNKLKMNSAENIKGEQILPYIETYSDDNKKTATVTANVIERNVEKKIIHARGNVILESYGDLKSNMIDIKKEDDNKPVILGGEWADMKDDEKKIILKGNPYIINGGSKIYATEIVVDTENNQVEISGKIRGILTSE
ncbi:MAG: hypothetical protein OEZ22_06270 [Spirochaetia bacterium]|nr:hypothetical protein [Spirochaetia bacterium]